MLITGFPTRLVAIGTIENFIGVIATTHINNDFFMNWYKQLDRGVGLKYLTLLFGLALIALIAGGGKAGVDAVVLMNRLQND